MPQGKPRRLAARRTPAGLLPCRSPAPTRKNLLLRPQLPAHQSQSIREGRTGLVVPGCSADDTFALGHVSMGEERDQRKQVPATPGLFSGSPAPTNAAGAFPTLTERKREILHLIAQGTPTLRSPGKCRRAQRPSATTSPTSLPSFKLLTGCRRSSVPGKQAWGRARRGRLQATGVRLRVLDGSGPVYLCTRAVSRSVQRKTCNLLPVTYNREAKCLECS